jgi:hypothetical protein
MCTKPSPISSLLPTTYYLLPTTYYLLPTSYYLLPTTYYLLPTTYYLLPTTYYILLGSSLPIVSTIIYYRHERASPILNSKPILLDLLYYQILTRRGLLLPRRSSSSSSLSFLRDRTRLHRGTRCRGHDLISKQFNASLVTLINLRVARWDGSS